MGTSGAFGGSGAAKWADARVLFDQIDPQDRTPTPGAAAGESPSAEAFWKTTLEALLAADHALKSPTPHIAISDLLPRRLPSSGGVASRTGPSTATGRSRRTSQQIGRGAAALAAGYAVARGDAAALRTLGLALRDFDGLSASERCQRIIDEVVGLPGHPDDEALRRAVEPTLIRLLTDGIDDPIDFMREYLVNVVMEATLVELSSKHARGELTAAETEANEKHARGWMQATIEALPADLRAMSPQAFVDLSLELTGKVLRIVTGDTQ